MRTREEITHYEHVILGAVLQERSAFPRVAQILDESCFTTPLRKEMFRAISRLFAKGYPIDMVTVMAEMSKKEVEVHAIALEMSEMTAKVASSANIEHHSYLLLESAIQREVPEMTAQISRINDKDPAEALAYGIREITRQAARMMAKTAKQVVTSPEELARSIISRKSDRESGRTPGISTGLPELDKYTAGFFPGDLIIIGGRPGMGKSALMVSIAHGMTLRGSACGILSLEMSSDDITNRLLAIESGVDYSRIRKGTLTDAEMLPIGNAIQSISKLKIYVDDQGGIDTIALRAKAKQMVDNWEIKVLFVDYLQLVTVKGMKNGYEIVTEVSKTLKNIAKELNIAVVALAQLNREVEKNPNKIPLLSNLKESGQIEQDADMVILCWRPEYYDIQSYDGGPTMDTLYAFIEKFRNGSPCEVVMDCFIGTNRIDYQHALAEPQKPAPSFEDFLHPDDNPF